MTVHLQAVDQTGRRITASGPTRAIARQRLIERIEQTPGQTFRQMHGTDIAEFAEPVQRFAELPDAPFECVCIPAGPDGRLVCSCSPSCSCTDKTACQCGGGHSNFSERSIVKTPTKPGRRKFDDAGGDIEELRGRLADLIASADEGLLRKLADYLGSEDFDETDDAANLAPGATSNLTGSGAGFCDKNAERRIKKFCEQVLFVGTATKFNENSPQVREVINLFKRSGQDIDTFLPRGF